MEKNKENRNKKTKIALLLLLLIGLFVIGGTYARYSSLFNGDTTLKVAKWSVKLEDGASAQSGKFGIELTADESDDVVEGKIAPGLTASGSMDIDLTDTEVSVDIVATLDPSDIKEVLGDVNATIKLSVGENESGEIDLSSEEDKVTVNVEVPLEDGAFDKDNGVITVNIELKWEDGDDTADTTLGEAGEDLTIPITLTVEQHI